MIDAYDYLVSIPTTANEISAVFLNSAPVGNCGRIGGPETRDIWRFLLLRSPALERCGVGINPKLNRKTTPFL